MIIPSKFITTDQSVLGKAVYIVDVVRSSKDVVEAFHAASSQGLSIDDFILCMDLLWIMDVISVDMETGVVEYAHSN